MNPADHDTAVTLIEIMVVIIIIGVLATLGLTQMSGPREQALDQEAIGNLKLIAAAQRIRKLEIESYAVSLFTTADVNRELNLMLPDGNWRYAVTTADDTIFSAVAERQVPDDNSWHRGWCISQDLDEPVKGLLCD